MKFKFAKAVAAATLLVCPMAISASPASAASLIQITKVQFDSSGTDTGSNTSLNGEWVAIKNTGTSSRTLTGWTLRDKSAHVFTFPKFTLAAGATMYVKTGKGSNTSSRLYWQNSYYVWNNTGDTAYLRNSAGTLADSCAWTSRGTGYKLC